MQFVLELQQTKGGPRGSAANAKTSGDWSVFSAGCLSLFSFLVC